MSNDEFDLIKGSGNVFRDMGYPDANLRQARALVAARIIRQMNEQRLSTRGAAKLTGVAHTEFSRIRNAHLDRFTLDRMIVILGKLLGDDLQVELEVRVSPRAAPRSTLRPA